jgi:voltage-gated potassium channel
VNANARSSRSNSAPLISLWVALARFRRRILWTVAYFGVVLLIGTVGYHSLEEWSYFDAFYMSVITATCVGYDEVHPLTDAGRTFTVVLLGLSVVGLGLLWAITTAMIVELDLRDVFRRHRTMKRIEDLSGHYIICGAGRMGRVIIEEMRGAGVPFVVVEKSPERIAALQQTDPELLAIETDATRENALEQAGVERARGLATCLASDGDNLLVSLTARELNRNLDIVARANDEESLGRMRRAGADHVISPNITGGVRMAAMLLRPSVVSFLDTVTHEGELSLRLEQAHIQENSPLAGKTLAEAQIPQKTGLVVLAMRPAGGDRPARYNPGPETRLEPGDVMIVLGQPAQVDRLREYVRG